MHPSPKILAFAGVASVLTLGVVPAAAAKPAADRSDRVVTAVVTVRPGAALPVSVPGGRVTHVFRGIGSEVYYPVPMHLQTCFEHLGYRSGEFPVSEELAVTSLALPVYPELPAEDIEYVCTALNDFYTA